MKVKIVYQDNDITSVEAYLAINNPTAVGRKWKDIHDNLVKIATENAISVLAEDDDSFVSWSSTAGYVMLFAHDGFSKKGYPIIQVDIFVQPSFGYSEYIEENFEI